LLSSGPPDPDSRGVEKAEASEYVRFVGDQIVRVRVFSPTHKRDVNNIATGPGIELRSNSDPPFF
jgi:hypothetical protein